MVLLVAPPMNRIVLVLDVPETVVLEIVRELPPVFNPSIVTLSAPFKLSRGLPQIQPRKWYGPRHRMAKW